MSLPETESQDASTSASSTPTLEPRLGLALSGGGFRASAFHLGVLKRLEELDVLPHISLFSTVSGGSITGALYALRCAERKGDTPGAYSVDDLIEELRPHLQSNFRGRAFFGNPLRVLRVIGSFTLPWLRRMPLVVNAFDRAFFKGASVAALPRWIVINATSLATGKAWKFFCDRAGDYLIGATDKTADIRLAEAVGASAAFPVLVDPYPFRIRWEDLRGDLLDDRWERPTTDRLGGISRWRERYGQREGGVIVALVDGGVYDNEGLNSLRGAKITHPIVSSTAPPESEHFWHNTIRTLSRTVLVMHSRLGALTRQNAHEMTHGVHPSIARTELKEMAAELADLAASSAIESLHGHANRLERLASVGQPSRGPQFNETAQILLHQPSLAQNGLTKLDGERVDVPPQYRGLDVAIVEELSRVRTDLDALEPQVLDLLIAQGYFLTDVYLKCSMADVVQKYKRLECLDEAQGYELPPNWSWAQDVVAAANANKESTIQVVRRAAKQTIVGRSASRRYETVRLWFNLVIVVLPIALSVLTLFYLLLHLLRRCLWG